MAFHSLSEFLQMGGYAAFVWPAYFICIGGFVLNSIVTRKKYFNNLKRLKIKHASHT